MKSKRDIDFEIDMPNTKRRKIVYDYHEIIEVKLYRDIISKEIFVGFDYIAKSYCEEYKLPLNLYNNFKTSKDSNKLENKFFSQIFDEAADVEKTFFRSKISQTQVLDEISGLKYAKTSLFYKFPTQQHAALNWLVAFIHFLNNNATFIKFSLNQYEQFDDFINGTKDSDINISFINNVRSTVQFILIEKLLTMKISDDETDPYHQAFHLIDKIYSKYKLDRENKIQIPFVFYATENIRTAILNQITNQNIDLLLNFAKLCIHNNQPQRIEKAFSGHNALILTQLYGTVLNKKHADDNNLFQLSHTEFDFFFHASSQFAMTQNGNLSIISLHKNEGYLRHYQTGKRNYHIFEREIIHLANALELNFINKNFHDEGCLIFDPVSTEKLLAMDLICVENKIQEIKSAIYKMNFHNFFRRSQINNNDGKLNIKHLPDDVMNCIQIVMEDNRRRRL